MKGVMFNGSPTGADVRKLLDAFGAPPVGWEVTHEAVADVLGVEIGGHRYRTVIAAWRKTLLDRHDVDLGSVHGVGYRALNAQERVDIGIAGSRVGMRKILRSARRGDRVVTEDQILCHKQAVQRRLVNVLTRDFQDAIKEFSVPSSDRQQKRLPPPGEAT